MPTTKDILERDDWRCRFCSGEHGRADTRDHFIKRRHLHRIEAKRERENPLYQAAACHTCNGAVATRCFVPADSVHLIPDLERITGSVYGVYDGDAATLREVLA